MLGEVKYVCCRLATSLAPFEVLGGGMWISAAPRKQATMSRSSIASVKKDTQKKKKSGRRSDSDEEPLGE